MLKRGIRKWDLVLLVINSIIGAGIFGLPSKVFALSGIYSLVAYIICAFIVLVFIGCFAEVSSRFDRTGGPYIYALEAFGKFPGFIIGWLLFLNRIFIYATLINLLVIYLKTFSPGFGEIGMKITVITLLTGLLTLLNYSGIQDTTRFNNFFTIAKLATLLFFIVLGVFFIDWDIYKISAPPAFPEFSHSVLLLVFAFGGFESVLINTGEIRNPAKTLPFGLIIASLVVALFYTLIQFVSIGTLPGLATSERPLAEAATLMMGKAGGVIITLGATLSIAGTLNVLMLSGSRMPFAMSEEKQLPPLFSKLQTKQSIPMISLLTFSLITCLVSILWTFLGALTVSVIIRILTYVSVCMALILFRRRKNISQEYFKIRYGYLLAFLGILFSGWLLSYAESKEILTVSGLIVLGSLIFLLYRATIKKGPDRTLE